MSPPETTQKPPISEDERRQIVKLLKRLPHQHSLREVVYEQTGNVQNTPETLNVLLGIVDEPLETGWAEHWLATTLLREQEIPTECSLELAVVLGKMMNGTDASIAARWILRVMVATGYAVVWVMGCMLAGGLLGSLENVLGRGELSKILFLLLLLAGIAGTPLVFFATLLSESTKAENIRLAAAKTLSHLQLPESVEALAKAARGEDSVKRLAIQALASLLPTLTEAHSDVIGTRTVPNLCALLDMPDIPRALKGKILDVLELIGDGRAVEPVQEMAKWGSTPNLRARAESILPVLLARRERERASSMLLRGSSAPETKPTELLRAASYASATEPEQLLRPTLGPQNNTNTPNG